jgi:hypothetical protein
MRQLLKGNKDSAITVDSIASRRFTFSGSNVEKTADQMMHSFGVSDDFVCIQHENKDSNLVDSASSIRLSQRLSHACLSINNFIRETANGSLYQL